MTTTTATEQAALLVLRQLVADIEAGVVGVVAQASADGPEGCSLTVRWAAIDKVVERAPAPTAPPPPTTTTGPVCSACGPGPTRRFDDGAVGCLRCGAEWRPD